MVRIALLDYGMGNLGSVTKALVRSGAEVQTLSSPDGAESCDGLLLPGVGNFGIGMQNLRERGFASLIRDWTAADKPFLGICLGMQMLTESSEEAPGTAGLGIFPGSCLRFPEGREKVPHVGWNQLRHDGKNPFLKGIPSGAHFYFVHSYYVKVRDPSDAAAETDYIFPFVSALGRGRVFAAQFHPEKSQRRGLALLENFIQICKEK